METPEVIKSKKGIIMRTRGGHLVELSQEGDCDGVKPGDKFIFNGLEELVIGFSDNDGAANYPFSFIWTLTKGEKAIGFWPAGGRIDKHKSTLINAEKALTAETTESVIMKFLNS